MGSHAGVAQLLQVPAPLPSYLPPPLPLPPLLLLQLGLLLGVLPQEAHLVCIICQLYCRVHDHMVVPSGMQVSTQ
jgi:hypothetical protein